jgi:hypothetical protein
MLLRIKRAVIRGVHPKGRRGMKTLLGFAALVAMTVSPALANHANPWATGDDVVLSRFHDENQARSADTPGEDEMRGKMTRSANGKTGESGSTRSGSASKGGQSGNGDAKGSRQGRN